MLDMEYGNYFVVCDGCHEVLDGFESFDEAVEGIKDEGWSTNKEGVVYEHYCPACQEAM